MSTIVGLTGSQFIKMMISGHQRLQAHVGEVNALNVFPVPDGDTGTNMELSLRAGIEKLQVAKEYTLQDASYALATGLLMGARGNSGVILSQLFRGFQKVTQRLDLLDVAKFAQALSDGVQIAYQAVSKPVEGTILTVAREAAAVGLREVKQNLSLDIWMERVIASAHSALAETPEQLPVLKQAGVVDSGGQGFVFILEGFLSALRAELSPNETGVTENNHTNVGSQVSPSSSHIAEVEELDVLSLSNYAAAHMLHEDDFGYCTEVLIRTEVMAEDVTLPLRQQLSTYGDSLLVVGAHPLVKVHVHTEHPGRVLEDAMAYGSLVKIKIENMSEQHAEIIRAKESVHISSLSAKTSDGSPLLNTILVSRPKQPCAIVAVCAGEGIHEVYKSLGVDVVVSGGPSMNPSTEQLVDAIRLADADHVILLPNNKNIYLAAQQASALCTEGSVSVIATSTLLHGIAALMEYHPDATFATNVQRMAESIQDVLVGQVVKAVKDSTFQDRFITAGQYMGFINERLAYVGNTREAVGILLVNELTTAETELVTLFYGEAVEADEVEVLVSHIQDKHLDVEARFGGQPIYDYLFTVE